MTQAIQTRPPLPVGKHELEPNEQKAVFNHSLLMYRDATVREVETTLLKAAAVYNFSEFNLYRENGYETFQDFCDDYLKLTRMHANRYRQIGEQLSAYLGGGVVTAEAIRERIPTHVIRGKVSMNMLHALSKTGDGMQKLLAAKNEDGLHDVLSAFESEVKEYRAGKGGKSPKRLAAAKRYGPDNPPTQSDLTMLMDGVHGQLRRLNQVARKLESAVEAYADKDALSASRKYRPRMLKLYNELRELNRIAVELMYVWADENEVMKVIAQAAQGGVNDDIRQEAHRAAERAGEPRDPFYEETLARNEPVGEIPLDELESAPDPREVLGL